MGQPTHCYDALKISKNIILKNLQGNYKFQTLLDKEVELNDSNLVFLDDENITNIAGVIEVKVQHAQTQQNMYLLNVLILIRGK